MKIIIYHYHDNYNLNLKKYPRVNNIELTNNYWKIVQKVKNIKKI